MNRLTLKKKNAERRANRVASVIRGSAERPRLAVHISNTHISAQLIDDASSNTIASASTVGKKLSGTMTEKAAEVGKDIAAQAKKVKISRVVFDRSSKQYHGRVKALAEAARQSGLEF